MRVSLVGSHMVSAWAREERGDWRGFAAIEPPLAQPPVGAPQNESLCIEGVHLTEKDAENAAFRVALEALKNGTAREE